MGKAGKSCRRASRKQRTIMIVKCLVRSRPALLHFLDGPCQDGPNRAQGAKKGRRWEQSRTQPKKSTESAALRTRPARSLPAAFPAIGSPHCRGCGQRGRGAAFISPLHGRVFAGLSPAPPATWWLCPHAPRDFRSQRGTSKVGGEGGDCFLAHRHKPRTFATAAWTVVTARLQSGENRIQKDGFPADRLTDSPSTLHLTIAWQIDLLVPNLDRPQREIVSKVR